MRILLACPYSWDAPGGVQVHVRQLAENLIARGHVVVVLTPGTHAPAEPWVRTVGRPLRIPYKGTVAPICFSRRSWRRIRAAVHGFRPDVVHAHEPFSPSTSMLAVLAAESPVVATFHAHLDGSRLLAAATPALRVVRRRIAGAMAVSRAASGFAERAFGGPLDIVPNGVDVRLFSELPPPAAGLPSGRVLLWVGRLDPQKGFPVAVRAFARSAGEFEDLSFVIAGDGRDRDATDLLAPAHRSRVRMLGTVAHEQLPSYLAGTEVFVSSAIGQESFGVVLVEAMAAGVPVVASDIAGYREVVRDGVDGLLTSPGDPGALADGIRRILTEPGLAGRLRQAGRERAAEFSWERVVPRIEAVYRLVTGGPPEEPS